MGGALAQCSFKRWSPDRVVRVRALADTVLCSWARHVTLVVLLSTQVYKWVLANSIKQNARLVLQQGTLLLANISASATSLLQGQCYTEQMEIGTEKMQKEPIIFLHALMSMPMVVTMKPLICLTRRITTGDRWSLE